jgi:hypothetical protein
MRRVLLSVVVALVAFSMSLDAQRARARRIRAHPPASGACVFPSCFPDASNTGIPAGTSLTTYTGANPVTSNGTTITGKIFSGSNCPLVITAINVTISNSQFDCPSANALYVDDAANYVRTSSATVYAVTIQDSEIDCGNSDATGIQEADIHAIRVEIVGCVNGFSINQNVLIEDSYLHNEGSIGADPHEDGVELAFGHWTGSSYPCCAANMTFTHNTIFGRTHGDTQNGTSAIIANGGNGNSSKDVNIIEQQNLLAGGSFTIYCDQGFAGTNFQVVNNHFSTQFGALVGESGPSDDCADEILSGNVYHESGLPITLSAPAPQPIALFMQLFYARPNFFGMDR